MSSEPTLTSLFKPHKTDDKLEILDGYRGYLALCVVLNHFSTFFYLKDTYAYSIFIGLGRNVGVTGFFLLSSFLLTYRLMTNFDNSIATSRVFAIKIAQYFIRRFFNIYIVFVLFWSFLYSTPQTWNKLLISRPRSASFLDGVLLRNLDDSHLWTINHECKFYFLIPFITLYAFKFNRYWYWICLQIICFIGVFEFLYIDTTAIPIFSSLNVFLKGSLVAVVYFNLKKNETFYTTHIQNNKNVQIFIVLLILMLTLAQLYLFSYFSTHDLGVDFSDKSGSCDISACLLFLICLTNRFFVKYFYSLRFLRICGRYSYGMYLFHLMCIGMLYEWSFIFITYLEPLLLAILLAFLFGFIWFYGVQTVLMNTANFLCKKLDTLVESTEAIPKRDYWQQKLNSQNMDGIFLATTSNI